jgi:hypothetical protein
MHEDFFILIITRGGSNDTDSHLQNKEAAKRFLIEGCVQDSLAARVSHALTGVPLSIRTRLSRDWPFAVPSSDAQRTCHGQTHLLMGSEACQ